ncbi:Hypothetical protein R9X50_00785400 [Acrodontium crateriforme]|uniref:Uncharacterized protein n=1 Tax=Acrodontium crateriforme TaxID=150365 RepID=A0AAQ3MC29_9PEZI|nr:Hypothetical protein R9X50_00785400 [Acrodontium crateriforme]
MESDKKENSSSKRARETPFEARNIFAAGFNALGQLDPSHKGDIRSLQRIDQALPQAENGDFGVFFAGWGSAVFKSSHLLICRGAWTYSQDIVNEITGAGPRISFGDHNGMIGCLDDDGGLYVLPESSTTGKNIKPLIFESVPDCPRLGLIALAGNDQVAITFQQAPKSNLCHIAEFGNIKKFLEWYRDPSREGNYPSQHHMIPGRPKQLLANAATFTLLMEDGNCFTWGDSRHQTLGRPINGEHSIPADKPGILDALAGLNIVQVATGGWMNAALSQDGAAYLWGSGSPGSEHILDCLREVGTGEIALVNVCEDSAEPLDILDIAVGNGHAAVIAESGRVFVSGDNSNGQLGVGSIDDFISNWQEVERIGGAKSIVCGPKATFVIM